MQQCHWGLLPHKRQSNFSELQLCRPHQERVGKWKLHSAKLLIAIRLFEPLLHCVYTFIVSDKESSTATIHNYHCILLGASTY